MPNTMKRVNAKEAENVYQSKDLAAETNHANGPCFVYLAALVSALGGMLFGYDGGVISGAIPFMKTGFSLFPCRSILAMSRRVRRICHADQE